MGSTGHGGATSSTADVPLQKRWKGGPWEVSVGRREGGLPFCTLRPQAASPDTCSIGEEILRGYMRILLLNRCQFKSCEAACDMCFLCGRPYLAVDGNILDHPQAALVPEGLQHGHITEAHKNE